MARVRTALCAIAGVLVLVVAACGGSSSSSDTTSTTTTTTEPTTTAYAGGGGAGGKLSASEWASLQSAAAKAKSVNQQNIVTFQKCRKQVAAGGYSNQQIASCFGSSTTAVVNAGQEFNAALASAQKSASGACAATLGKMQGNVTLYISSVNALGLTVKQGQIPQTGDINSTLNELTKAQATAKTIAPACAPA
jgi:NADH dehydrogenase FAD-containing subunit